MNKELKIGSFYWIMPTLDPDSDEEWEAEMQPARYAGDGKWHCLNVEDVSDWPMNIIGDEIVEFVLKTEENNQKSDFKAKIGKQIEITDPEALEIIKNKTGIKNVQNTENDNLINVLPTA